MRRVWASWLVRLSNDIRLLQNIQEVIEIQLYIVDLSRRLTLNHTLLGTSKSPLFLLFLRFLILSLHHGMTTSLCDAVACVYANSTRTPSSTLL